MNPQKTLCGTIRVSLGQFHPKSAPWTEFLLKPCAIRHSCCVAAVVPAVTTLGVWVMVVEAFVKTDTSQCAKLVAFRHPSSDNRFLLKSALPFHSIHNDVVD